jgi:hypothetical protein
MGGQAERGRAGQSKAERARAGQNSGRASTGAHAQAQARTRTHAHAQARTRAKGNARLLDEELGPALSVQSDERRTFFLSFHRDAPVPKATPGCSTILVAAGSVGGLHSGRIHRSASSCSGT